MKRIFSLISCVLVAITMMAQQPKYIFYFIGDGMGMSPVLCAETYNRTVLKNTNPLLFLQFPVISFATTYCSDATITDSAASGTALSTGYKTYYNALGVDSDTVPVISVAKELKDRGYGIAIATSVDPDDATPGAFYAHVKKRHMFYDIAKDMAKCDYDFIAGGRLRGIAPKGEKDAKTLIKDAGYTIAIGPKDFESKKHNDKILLLNTDENLDHIGYAIDSIKENLSLPFITQACIDHEMRVSPDKFFMMIEGGLIDHALHANDAGAAIKEVIDFEKAIKIAYDFYLQHPDETLIVITADHNTGGLAAGVNGGSKVLRLDYFDYQKVSKENMQKHCKTMFADGETPSWDKMKKYLEDNFGLYKVIKLRDSEDKAFQQAFADTFVNKTGKDNNTLYASFNSFVSLTFKTLDRYTGLGWTTGGHTGDFVPVFAIGAGSEKFATFQDNTDIPNKIRQLCGIPTHGRKK